MPGKLSAYHAKRDFRITPEPASEVAAPSERLRFVVQKHDARRQAGVGHQARTGGAYIGKTQRAHCSGQ